MQVFVMILERTQEIIVVNRFFILSHSSGLSFPYTVMHLGKGQKRVRGAVDINYVFVLLVCWDIACHNCVPDHENFVKNFFTKRARVLVNTFGDSVK